MAMVWVCLTVLVGTVPAATLTVTTTADELDGNGDCSLREAVRAANLNVAVGACSAGAAGHDTVMIPAGTYVLSLAGDGEDAAVTGDLDVTEALTLIGAGASSTILDGNDTGNGVDDVTDDRVLDVFASTVAQHLTVRNGFVLGFGGGVRASAPFTGDFIVVSGNTARSTLAGGAGGGIAMSDSTLVLTNSRVEGNRAVLGAVGGGIALDDAPATIAATTISANAATGDADGGGIDMRGGSPFAVTMSECTVATNEGGPGGGMLVGPNAVLVLSNSTVSDNASTASGGGLRIVGASAVLRNVTIAGNRCDADLAGLDARGGGLQISGGSEVTLRNTILAGNVDPTGATPEDDCAGPVTSGGWNLVQSIVGCTLTPTTGDLIGVDPLLESLQDNGGPTQTRALPSASPAVDAGDPSIPSTCTPTDQRGLSRPQGLACDIGAFERGDFIPTTTQSVTTSSTITSTTTSTTTSSTVTSSSTTLPSLLRGASITLRDDRRPTRRALVAVSTDGAALSLPEDPRTAGGGTLAVRIRTATDAAGQIVGPFTVPAGAWRPIGRRRPQGFVAKASSPIRAITLRAGRRLRIVARGAELGFSLATAPTQVDVELTIAGQHYCLRFGEPDAFSVRKRYLARSSAAPDPSCSGATAPLDGR
jgi:CSLREA domain-containing protein